MEKYITSKYASKVEGVCDDRGGSLYQRKDDTYETIMKRLKVYEQQTKPLLEYYNEQGNIININGATTVSVSVNEIINKLGGY